MHLRPVNIPMSNTSRCSLTETSFGNKKQAKREPYSLTQKAVVATTTALGVAASCALLAKKAGYSLTPKKMFSNIKNSYLAKVHYEWPEVVAIGAGSCLGGLAGGYLIDKDKENRKVKQREAIMHFGNIAIPIFTVGMVVDKVFKNSNKWVKAGAGLGGIVAGLYLANFVTNKTCSFLFKDKSQERGIEVTDLPAHLDDAVVAAGYISKSKIVHALGRIIPLALMVAGNEVGTKTVEDLQ